MKYHRLDLMRKEERKRLDSTRRRNRCSKHWMENMNRILVDCSTHQINIGVVEEES